MPDQDHDYDYDFFVIGAGSGGVRAARIAASLGARTAICEDKDMGGTCVNLGCVPKKLFVYASEFSHQVQDAAGYGWTVEPPRFDWPTLVANKDREISRLNAIYDRILGSAGVEVIKGRGTLADANTVMVGARRFTAKHILIATGGRPYTPPGHGYEHLVVSDALFSLKTLPKRIAILGGGYIGVEFAGIFDGLGSEVTLLHRGASLLRGFDADCRRELTEALAESFDVRLETKVIRIDKTGDAFTLTLDDDTTLEVDLAICACGRRPNTANLGLEALGVDLDDQGAVIVDAHYRTNVPSIYAVGDVIDRAQLTPVALEEGMQLAIHLFGEAEMTPVDYGLIPSAVFSQPQLASVGLTEADARLAHACVEIYTSRFTPMRHQLTTRKPKTFMKLIVDADDQRVIGCHMVGPDAAEIMQGIAVVLQCRGTKADFDRTIGIHPSAAEEFVTMRTRTR
ncbi:MAG: glutathione reductase (NADPH) [Myxococcota bacterium]|jgi:glutathione reductase (NADPH)